MNKRSADNCFVLAWNRDRQLTIELGEHYYRLYRDETGEYYHDLETFIFALYWLSIARNHGFYQAYVMIVKLLDDFYSEPKHGGYLRECLNNLIEINWVYRFISKLGTYDGKRKLNIYDVNLAELFISEFAQLYFTLDKIRNEYTQIASEHGYSVNSNYDDYDDEEAPESGAKAKYTYLYDIIKRFIDCSFREKYEYEPLVQNYKKQFVKEFQEFGEGNEFENDHSFYFKHEYASGHSAIEVYTESNFIQITSCGYAIGNCGGDSYTNWQCTLYNDGEEEADVEVNGIMEELNTFPYADSTLTIDSPDEFYFNGEVNDDDDSE